MSGLYALLFVRSFFFHDNKFRSRIEDFNIKLNYFIMMCYVVLSVSYITPCFFLCNNILCSVDPARSMYFTCLNVLNNLVQVFFLEMHYEIMAGVAQLNH